ncbi:MAG TPA: hypothetical protein ENG50_02785 [Candidatus Altiarchaeales archaeon]|nr:hypothetical protein [Candidatus Altiarchaeales archaeon]
MATLKSAEIKDNEIILKLKISQEEYKLVGAHSEFIILPSEDEALSELLTTGKLGNGNRIMIPNRLLKKYEIKKLKKKVPAKVFKINEAKYLLIKLEDPASMFPWVEE